MITEIRFVGAMLFAIKILSPFAAVMAKPILTNAFLESRPANQEEA